MATNTYVALDTQTLTSTAGSVTFSSIPQTYTDLIIIAQIKGTANTYLNLRFNGDTGSNYSRTVLSGSGSTVTSERRTNQTAIATDYNETIQTNLNYITTLHIMNYANSTTNKTVLCRPNNAATGVGATVGLWRNTAAITSVDLVANNNSFDSGSTFTLYGISSAGDIGTKATGGTITQDATHTYHTFTMSGNFVPNQSLTADMLVVAGGGAGGTGAGGGGGAGGVLGFASQSLTAQRYTVTVGGGGARGVDGGSTPTNGSDSQFGSLTASIGGGRGSYYTGPSNTPALTGGSGGGGGYDSPTGAAGTSGQGFAGGNGSGPSTYGCGGGGGAGGVGVTTSTAAGGNGGPGVNTYTNATWLSTGLSVTGMGVSGYIAGGGGGGSQNPNTTQSSGGTGGGGAGGTVNVLSAVSGIANTGSGGGGGASGIAGVSSGAGGSGIVIIRYAN